MIGRTYLERGLPVTVVARWGSYGQRRSECWVLRDGRFVRGLGRGAPRNVLVERAGGARLVRPFRGLRRAP